MTQTLETIPTALMPVMELPKRNVPDMPTAFLDPQATVNSLFPSNYFSMEELDHELQSANAEALILTVDGVSYELVHDPSDRPTPDDWRPCLRFKEREEMLVLGKNRAKAFAKIVQHRVIAKWADIVQEREIQVALHVGRIQGKEQLCLSPVEQFMPVTNGQTLDDINDELFG